ncbi:hypothetical protein F5X96DRAFT_694044 [Biscogniauxia mediterranea]|nr:hypothetical protein F5X96DRAFT_694044 [Biscogniauxia mediterranea]
MSTSSYRALRGSCQCGRNQYIVQIPNNTSEAAQVLFDSDASHRIASAAPLSAFIRVPLSWYHSQTFAFFPDESTATIRRVYSHPAEQYVRRNFCGFCGTPLSYWTEQPRSEADYIQLTLGSLLTEDLHDLEEMGLIPDESELDVNAAPATATASAIPSNRTTQLVGRDITGIPWFETMISGSRLGNMHTTKTVRQSRDGRMRVEFEVTEWTGTDEPDDEASASESSTTGKRKRGEVDDDDNGHRGPSNV